MDVFNAAERLGLARRKEYDLFWIAQQYLLAEFPQGFVLGEGVRGPMLFDLLNDLEGGAHPGDDYFFFLLKE